MNRQFLFWSQTWNTLLNLVNGNFLISKIFLFNSQICFANYSMSVTLLPNFYTSSIDVNFLNLYSPILVPGSSLTLSISFYWTLKLVQPISLVEIWRNFHFQTLMPNFNWFTLPDSVANWKSLARLFLLHLMFSCIKLLSWFYFSSVKFIWYSRSNFEDIKHSFFKLPCWVTTSLVLSRRFWSF